nr:Uma2 family endonuclease [Desulfamplus magnetovallimortis]
MIPQEKIKMTPDEYLELEENSDTKHEYFHGEVFAMVGARKNHNIISFNISRELGNQIKKTPCMGFGNDQRVKIDADKYVYPDIVVACDEIIFLEDELDSLINPVLIMEILSNSTEIFDRGDKFQYYQSIDSLKEYILVSQHKCLVEQFVRNKENHTWTYTAYPNIDQTLSLESVKCDLPLSEIYYRVDFDTL